MSKTLETTFNETNHNVMQNTPSLWFALVPQHETFCDPEIETKEETLE